jgi:hypothetical protein
LLFPVCITRRLRYVKVINGIRIVRYNCIAVILFLVNAPVLAATSVPFVFTSGTAAKASEVNADFAALSTAIDSGIPGYEIMQQTFSVSPSGGAGVNFTANCTAGKASLGGGYDISGPAYIQGSWPANVTGLSNTGWTVQVNSSVPGIATALTLHVYAICALAHP